MKRSSSQFWLSCPVPTGSGVHFLLMYVLLPVITPHRGLVRFLNAAPERIIPTTRLPAAPPKLHTGLRVEALHTTGREREHHQEAHVRTIHIAHQVRDGDLLPTPRHDIFLTSTDGHSVIIGKDGTVIARQPTKLIAVYAGGSIPSGQTSVSSSSRRGIAGSTSAE